MASQTDHSAGERGQRIGGLLRFGAALLTGCLAAPAAHADTIKLKNGNKFEGRVIERSEKRLVIEIPGAGKMTFDPAEIASIRESAPKAQAAGPVPAPAAPAADAAAVSPGSEYLPDEPSPAGFGDSGQWEETEEDDPRKFERENYEVLAMGVRIRDNDGVYSAVISFRDNKHKPCSTRGRLMITREVTEYKKDFKIACVTCVAEEVKIPYTREQSVRSVNFKPSDFERNGSSLSFEVHFRPGEVNPGDDLTFEWRSFKVKQTVPGDRSGSLKPLDSLGPAESNTQS